MYQATSYFYLALVSMFVGEIANADDAAPHRRNPPDTLPRVVVTGRHVAEDGYRVDAVDSLGPLGTAKILDTLIRSASCRMT